MTQILLYAHILLFAFSFAFTSGYGILLERVAATRDVKSIHATFSAAMPLSAAGGAGWILTAITGGALAHFMGYDMAATWLIASYVLFVVLAVVGFGMHKPWHGKVITASANGGGPELEAVLTAPSHRIATMISAVGILVLVYLMVARPG